MTTTMLCPGDCRRGSGRWSPGYPPPHTLELEPLPMPDLHAVLYDPDPDCDYWTIVEPDTALRLAVSAAA